MHIVHLKFKRKQFCSIREDVPFAFLERLRPCQIVQIPDKEVGVQPKLWPEFLQIKKISSIMILKNELKCLEL